MSARARPGTRSQARRSSETPQGQQEPGRAQGLRQEQVSSRNAQGAEPARKFEDERQS